MILFLSESAKTKLIVDAYWHGYKRTTKGMRDVNKYIAAVCSVKLYDARPDHAKQEAEMYEREGRYGAWFPLIDTRIATRMYISAHVQKLVLAVALEFNIVNHRNTVVKTPASIVSAVVEAIGNGWLKPLPSADIPKGEHYHVSARKRASMPRLPDALGSTY